MHLLTQQLWQDDAASTIKRNLGRHLTIIRWENPQRNAITQKGSSTRRTEGHREPVVVLREFGWCGVRCESGGKARRAPYWRGDARWCDCLHVESVWGCAGAAEDASTRGERRGGAG